MRETADDIGPEQILSALKSQTESLGRIQNALDGGEETSLINQLKLLRQDLEDSKQEAQRQHEDFAIELWKKSMILR